MSRRFLTTLALCVLVALGAVLAADAPGPSSAAFPGLNGKIGFTSDRTGNLEIFSANADGSAQTNLTNHPAFDLASFWSPDGGRILFFSDRDHPVGEIYVMNANGSGVTRLTNNTAYDEPGGWSPDGTKIVFNRDGEIYTMNANGTGAVQLTTNAANDFAPKWSPDGTKIAFGSNRDGQYEIYVMNTDGSAQTRLTNNLATDYEPAWSPDAQQIAFVSNRDGNFEIYTMFWDGSGQTNVSNNSGFEEYPAWSPDGTKIAFNTNRDAPPKFELYSMNADGSAQTRLTNVPAADDGQPDWQPVAPSNPHGVVDLANAPLPQPTQITFSATRDGNFEIYTMDEDGSDQVNLTNHAAGDGSSVYSPDGTMLAFHSDRDGDTEVYVSNADGSDVLQLTTDPGFDGYAGWSPDGTKLAFASDRDGDFEIFTMNADGTGQTPITSNASTVDYVPAWSPRGDQIAFARNAGANSEIYVMNADGTNQVNLTNLAGDDDFPTWSPTGAKIAFHTNRDGNYEIYSMNADGTQQTNLSNIAADQLIPAWSPTGERIAYMCVIVSVEICTMGADGTGQTQLTSDAFYDAAPDWRPPVLGLSNAPAPAITYVADRPTQASNEALNVASGDVNGDDVDDLIIGNPLANALDGQISVVYGSPALGANAPATIDLLYAQPNVVLTAPDGLTDVQLGYGVHAADVDGDGIDDIVSATLAGEGRAYVIYGEGDWPAKIDLFTPTAGVERTVITAVGSGDGMNVATAGNVMGDAKADVLLGAPLADGPLDLRTDAGEAYVVQGAALLRTTTSKFLGSSAPDATIYGVDVGDQLGAFVRAGGSISGDANGELYLGAAWADGGVGSVPARNAAGEVEILFGPIAAATRDLASNPPDLVVVGADAFDFFAAAGSSPNSNILGATATAGDGIGNTEVDAGEFFFKQGSFSSGTVIDTAAAGNRLRVFGADAGDRLSPNQPLDLNGDGYQDIVIGSYFADGPGAAPGNRTEAGEAHVFYGSSGALVSGTIDLGAPPPYLVPYQRLFGAAAGDLMGHRQTAGDFNGDGKQDVVIVAPGAEYGGRNNVGKLYVFLSDTPRLKLDATPGGPVEINRNVHLGESFSIGLRIEDVPALVGLRSFDVQIAYSDALLEGVSIAPGDFFNGAGPYTCTITTIGAGAARLACSYNGPAPVPGPAGRGDLLTVSFRARTTSVTSTPVTITSATLTEPARSTNYSGVTTAGITLGLELIDTAAGGGGGCDDSDADGCAAADLDLSAARGLAPGGSVFVADTGAHVIRRIEGDTSFRVAGAQGLSGYVDGFFTTARFNQPSGIDTDSAGNVYVADAGNHRVRKITPAGLVTTIAGGGAGCAEPCSALSQSLSNPRDVAADPFGNVYVADTSNCRVRKIEALTGLITTVAGTTCGFADGPVATAQLNAPEGVAVEPFTNVSQTPGILVSDTVNDRIRRVANGQVTTIAGGGAGCPEPCAATSAQLQQPRGLSVDGSGRIFLANSDVNNPDTANNRVRRIDPNGMITTVAGGGAGCFPEPCPALQQSLDTTNDVVLDEEIFAATDELVKVVFSAGDVRSRTGPAPSPCVATGNNAGDTALMFAPLLGLAFVSAGWRWRRRMKMA